MSLIELIDRGEHDDHPHAPQSRPPGSPLEWLGLAVGELPFLSSSARLVDDLNWQSLAPNRIAVHLRLIDALGQQLASSAALLHRSLKAYIDRRPGLGTLEMAFSEVDELAHALVEGHPLLSRRADLLLGGYASALAAAIQSGGRLGDAELATAAGDEGPDPALMAVVAYDGLTQALATLLGHARLNARDRDFVSTRMAS